MIRVLGVLVAVLLALAVPATADQRPDGFGPPGIANVAPPPRDADMGMCRFEGYVQNPAGETHDVWVCTSGAIVLWPTPCQYDPLHPCKES